MKHFLLKISALFAALITFSPSAEACTCPGSSHICEYLSMYPQSNFFKIRLDSLSDPDPSTQFVDYGISIIDQYNGNQTISSTYWLNYKDMGSCAGFLPSASQVGDTFLITLFGGSGIDTGSLWTCSFVQRIKNDSLYEGNQPSFPINDLQDSITACLERIELSTKNIDLAASIQVYPNPAREILNINNRSGATILSVQLSDITGRKMLLQEGKNMSTLPLGTINSGLYFLQIKTDKGIITRKINIEK